MDRLNNAVNLGAVGYFMGLMYDQVHNHPLACESTCTLDASYILSINTTHIHINLINTFIHSHKQILTYIHTYIHTHIHTYTHTHIHTYTHSYIHTHLLHISSTHSPS